MPLRDEVKCGTVMVLSISTKLTFRKHPDFLNPKALYIASSLNVRDYLHGHLMPRVEKTGAAQVFGCSHTVEARPKNTALPHYLTRQGQHRYRQDGGTVQQREASKCTFTCPLLDRVPSRARCEQVDTILEVANVESL